MIMMTVVLGMGSEAYGQETKTSSQPKLKVVKTVYRVNLDPKPVLDKKPAYTVKDEKAKPLKVKVTPTRVTIKLTF